MNIEIKTLSGKVTKKIENQSTNPKAPKGFIWLEGDERKFTVWKKELLDFFIVNSTYEIEYSHSENLYGGVTYDNYNITNASDSSISVNPKMISFSEEELEELGTINSDTTRLKKGDSNSGICILGHNLVVEEVKDIKIVR